MLESCFGSVAMAALGGDKKAIGGVAVVARMARAIKARKERSPARLRRRAEPFESAWKGELLALICASARYRRRA